MVRVNVRNYPTDLLGQTRWIRGRLGPQYSLKPDYRGRTFTKLLEDNRRYAILRRVSATELRVFKAPPWWSRILGLVPLLSAVILPRVWGTNYWIAFFAALAAVLLLAVPTGVSNRRWSQAFATRLSDTTT